MPLTLDKMIICYEHGECTKNEVMAFMHEVVDDSNIEIAADWLRKHPEIETEPLREWMSSSGYKTVLTDIQFEMMRKLHSLVKMNIVGTEILTWKEEGQWVAAWVRRYIVTQGATEKAAVSSLLRIIAYSWVFQEMHPEYEKVPPTPSDKVDEWKKLHEASHGREQTQST